MTLGSFTDFASFFVVLSLFIRQNI